MAKATTEIFGIVKIIALLVAGVFVFLYVRSVYAKTKDEKANDAEFKKRGVFASLGRFLFGDDAFADTGAPDTTQKEQEQAKAKDEAVNDASDLIAKAQEQAKKDKEIRAEAERQAEKVINKDPNKDPSKAIDEREKVIREQQAREEAAKKKDEVFDRTQDDFRIFRFTDPIQTSKGTVVDFAVKVIDPKKPEPDSVRIQRNQEAIKQAQAAGFTLEKDSLGRTQVPITALSQSTLDRIAKDPKLARSIELIQLRKLGLRTANSK